MFLWAGYSCAWFPKLPWKLKPNPKFHHEASYWCVCHQRDSTWYLLLGLLFHKGTVNDKGRAAAEKEEAWVGDSLQLLEGKLEWWKPLNSHPKVLWLGLHPVTLDDLPFLLLLPLSNSSASNSRISFLLSLSLALRTPAWLALSAAPRVRPCSQMCCLPAQPPLLSHFWVIKSLFPSAFLLCISFSRQTVLFSLLPLCLSSPSSLPTRFSLFFRSPTAQYLFLCFLYLYAR